MKNINIISKGKMILISILTIVAFSGCGSNTETTIDINVSCVTNPTEADIATYITLNSGDVIVKDTVDAEITIYDDGNGNKKVCLVTPSAHIVR